MAGTELPSWALRPAVSFDPFQKLAPDTVYSSDGRTSGSRAVWEWSRLGAGLRNDLLGLA